MKLTYYGTAAAEGFPGMFCECDTCRRAKGKGGRNIRTRSQSAIDDTILIDVCPDTYLHIINYGLDLTKIKSVLVTHSHFDHFDKSVFACIEPGTAERSGAPLDVFAGESAYMSIVSLGSKRITPHLVKAYEHFETCGYTVTPIPAMHSSLTNPFNYIIAKDGRTILYGHDTGIYTDEIYDFISSCGFVFDLVSLDCTYGVKKKGLCDHHMNIHAINEVTNKLKYIGAVNEKTHIVANHFSHFCENTYDELAEMTKDTGITVSFDGMHIEVI